MNNEQQNQPADELKKPDETPKTPEPTPAPKEEFPHQRRQRPGGLAPLFLGVVLILIGLAYLAKNFGILELHIDLWRLWPLLIVLLGLSFVTARGWLSIILIIVLLAVLGATILFAIDNRGFRFSNEPNVKQFDRQIEVNRESQAQSAEVIVQTGAGELNVSAGGEKLVAGTFESNFMDLQVSSEVKGTEQVVTLSGEGHFRGINFGQNKNRLDIGINQDIPLHLNIDTGAADIKIDSSNLNAQEIDVDTGASNVELTIGDKADNAQINVDAGASSVTISLPRSLGARLNLSTGLTSKNLTDFNQVGDKLFESKNYNDAAKKVTINLKLGVSNLNISWR